MKPAKILFFVDGPAPSADDFVAAAELKATVVFRNARAVPSEPHSLEICDGVAGKVPEIYAKAYPEAEKAIAKKAEELKALSSKVGDTPAPKPTGKGASNKPEGDKKPEGDGKPATPPAGGDSKPPAWNPNPAQ